MFRTASLGQGRGTQRTGQSPGEGDPPSFGERRKLDASLSSDASSIS